MEKRKKDLDVIIIDPVGEQARMDLLIYGRHVIHTDANGVRANLDPLHEVPKGIGIINEIKLGEKYAKQNNLKPLIDRISEHFTTEIKKSNEK